MNSLSVILLVVCSVASGDESGRPKPSIPLPPPCNSLPTVAYEFEDLIKYSPFNFYQTILNIYNCGKLVFTHYGETNDSYTGSGIIIQHDKAFSYDLWKKGNTVDSNVCPFKNARPVFNFVYVNFVSSANASYCVTTCAKNGKDYENLVCLGRTKEDYGRIQNFLVASKLDRVPGLKNAQEGCPRPKNCIFFTN